MNFKMIAAAAALVATGAANASLDNFNSANSSAVFFAYDTVTGTSVIADLGVNLNDFMPAYNELGSPGVVPQGQLDMAGAKAVWNLGANTLSINGAAISGASSNNWSSNFASFMSSVGTDTFKWAVIAGDSTSNVDALGKYLTSGNPTDAQLTNQAGTSTLVAVNTMYTNLASKMGSADNGSYFAATSSDTGYVAKNTNFNTQGNWLTNLDFQAVVNGSKAATSTSALSLMGEDDTAYRVGVAAGTTGPGLLQLDAANGTLTWQAASLPVVTPSVPEPSSYALALVGLAGALLARRRRAAK